MKSFVSAMVGATLALCVIEAGAQAAPGARQVSLTIESTSLATALDKWAQQSGFQIFVEDWEAAKGLTAPSLRGRFSAQAALDQLLEGTSLTYVWLNERAVSIRKKGSHIVPAPTLQRTGLEGRQALPVAKFSGDGAGGLLAASASDSAEASRTAPGHHIIDDLEEVVVTGSHIVGSKSAGSRVITLNRDYIAKSGHATVEGLFKTLPQNFGGGVGQGQAPNLSDENAGNFNEGTAINLRGLGVDSTLVLIDGRRQPGSGLSGAFVDISSIPVSAIERVEILPDGASAIYGSDAVAGVVNFILRKDFKGAESQLRFGDLQGGGEQLQISQLIGQTWSSGSALLGYQYDDRGSLQRNRRAFSASDDLRPLGGSDYRLSYSNPGNILDPDTFEPALGIPHGQDGTSLQADDLLPGVINYDTTSVGADLIGEQEMHSAFLNATQRLGDHLELFATGRFATRSTSRTLPAQPAALVVPSSNAFFVDPFGGSDAVFVAYNFSSDLGLTASRGQVDTYAGSLGATLRLQGDWRASFSGSYGREKTNSTTTNVPDLLSGAMDTALADSNPLTAFNPFGDGAHTSADTLAAIRTASIHDTVSEMRNGNLTVTGPLFRLGDASSMLAFGLDFRDEQLRGETSVADIHSEKTLDREVKAAFAEISLPLVTSGHAGLKELSASLAGRYEDYDDFGSTLNGRIGIAWVPADTMKVHATYGTSFKAPRLNQLVTDYPEAADVVLQLESPTGPVLSLIRIGNSADLSEETADVWSAGLEWTPARIPAFSADLTLWRVDYKDRVSEVGPASNPLGVLFDADTWAEVINFNPTRAQVDAICRSPTFVNPSNPVSVDECLALTPDAIVDLRLKNIALVRVQGIDLDAQYKLDTSVGAFTFGLSGTYTPNYDRQITRDSKKINVVDTTGNVLRIRARGEASWSRAGWDVRAFVNYAGGYEDTFGLADKRINAWTTVDAMVSYQFADSGTLLGGLTIALSSLNVFDSDPPFANVGYSNFAFGYDTTNANPFGRILSLQVGKVWGRGDRN